MCLKRLKRKWKLQVVNSELRDWRVKEDQEFRQHKIQIVGRQQQIFNSQITQWLKLLAIRWHNWRCHHVLLRQHKIPRRSKLDFNKIQSSWRLHQVQLSTPVNHSILLVLEWIWCKQEETKQISKSILRNSNTPKFVQTVYSKLDGYPYTKIQLWTTLKKICWSTTSI